MGCGSTFINAIYLLSPTETLEERRRRLQMLGEEQMGNGLYNIRIRVILYCIQSKTGENIQLDLLFTLRLKWYVYITVKKNNDLLIMMSQMSGSVLLNVSLAVVTAAQLPLVGDAPTVGGAVAALVTSVLAVG